MAHAHTKGCLAQLTYGLFMCVFSSAVAAAEPLTSLAGAMPEVFVAELGRVIEVARGTAPAVLQKRIELSSASAGKDLQRSYMLPSASGNLSVAQILEQRETTAGQDRELQAFLYGFGANQPIFHWGALSNAHKSAKIQEAIAHRNTTEALRLLLIDVRRRYLDLVISNHALSNARKARAALESEREIIKRQVDDGLLSSAAFSVATMQMEDMTMTIQRLENSLNTGRRSLAYVLGSNANIPVETELQIPALPNIGELIAKLSPAIASTPDRVANTVDAIRSEQLNLKVLDTRLLPKFNLSASVGQDNRNPDNDVLGPKQILTTWTGGVSVSWSIFDGFATRALRRQSKNRLRLLEIERQQAELFTTDERRSDIERLQFAWKSLQRAETNLQSVFSAITTAEKDLAAGIGTQKAVSDARASIDALTQAANVARADCYMAVVYLLSNRGEDPVLQRAAPNR